MFPLFCKEGLGELEIEKSYFMDKNVISNEI